MGVAAADYLMDGCGWRLDERRVGERISAGLDGGGEISPVGVPVHVLVSLWPFCIGSFAAVVMGAA